MTKKILLVIFLVSLFLSAGDVLAAGSATVSWTAPTTDEGGGALTGLAGYRACYSRASNMWTSSNMCSAPKIMQQNVLNGTVSNVGEWTCVDVPGGAGVRNYEFGNNLTVIGNETIYYFTVFAYDSSNNFSNCAKIGTSGATQISKTVTENDLTAPVITSSNIVASGITYQRNATLPFGINSATLNVSTNENAICRYARSAGVSFSSMTNNFTGSTTAHTVGVSSLVSGTNSFYVRCQDTKNNANSSDYIIGFNVASRTLVPPILSAFSPTGTLTTGTTGATLRVTTSINSTCRFSTSNLPYSGMSANNVFIRANNGLSHSYELSGLTNGSNYNYYVRCVNYSTGDASAVTTDPPQISFSVATPTTTTPTTPPTTTPTTPPTTTTDNNNDSGGGGGSSSKKKSKKKKKKKKKSAKPFSISVSKKVVRNGQTIIERGKKFSKNSFVFLYFSRYGNVYYPPRKIKTSTTGAFAIPYLVRNKLRGTYSWYAVDLKTGRRSKTIYYTVK